MKKLLCGILAVLMTVSLTPGALAAKKAMEVSDEGVEFVKRFEGFSKTLYLDNGVWRVGYGSACTSDDYPRGITEEEATELLHRDLEDAAGKVNTYIDKYDLTLEQSQFDALVSFTYNLGSGWMDENYKFSSYLIDGIENYDDLTILDSYVVWSHVGQRVDNGVANRRLAEAMLFIYGDYEGGNSPEYTYVVLNPNGGEVDADVVCFRKGAALEDLPEATRDGYVFSGWFSDQTNRQAKETDIIEEPAEFSAKWFLDVKTPFTDVADGSWYYRYVGELFSKGVIDGMTPTTFEPEGSVTHGQALKLILLATGLEPSDEQIEGHWAEKYKNLAVDEGIISNDFCSNLDGVISRSQIAYLAARAMGLSDSSGTSPFKDTGDKNVMALYNAGIVEGTTEKDGSTYYYPDESITRAEISTIIWRILSYTETNSHPGEIQYGSHTIKVSTDVKKYTRDDENYYTKNGFLYYRGADTKVGIDVSSHQGEIDWKKVKSAGVDFAIIRVGGRGYGQAGNMYDDEYFVKNIEGATAAGIDVGVYYFSQAISVAEAEEEARYVLEHIKGYDLTYPVVYDWERIGDSDTRTYGLDTDTLCKAANAFCDMVKDAGYKPMVYFNSYCGYLKYDLSRVNQYDFWYARYGDVPGFYYDFDIWQYSDSGSVPGINGRVDLDISFVDYAAQK